VTRSGGTLRGVELLASRIAELSGRPLPALTRRDVALALLAVAPDDALESLPGIRRALLAAGNPLSAAFWESAESTLPLSATATRRSPVCKAGWRPPAPSQRA
jgi:hypothetical protein